MTVKTLEDLSESFALFDNWEDRYSYLVDLGKRVPAMEEAMKTSETEVKGCTSKVWMVSEIKKNNEGQRILHFMANSDSQIVSGLIYVLMLAYQNKPLEEMSSIDIEKSFEELGLAGHLSPNRRNGFFAMVSHIKSLAV